LSLVVEKK